MRGIFVASCARAEPVIDKTVAKADNQKRPVLFMPIECPLPFFDCLLLPVTSIESLWLPGPPCSVESFDWLACVSIDEKLAEAAALIRARYAIRLNDALQIAAAMEGEASLFLTNDKRVKKLDAIEVVVLSDYL